MQPKKITLELAWQFTLLSRELWRDSGTAQTFNLATAPGTAITVEPGGAWRSENPVTADAARLFDMFLPLCASTGRRLIVAQMGQSLDGRISTLNGMSHYINGPDGITHLHRLRALVDAVVVGAGTACADNPLLTVRHVPGPNPVRVIIDPNRRVPTDYQLFQNPNSPTLRLVADHEVRPGPGVTEIALPGDRPGRERHKLTAQVVLDTLAERGLNRVLIEGGGLTVSHFLEADVIDRLHVLVAPLIIGSGRPAFTLPPVTDLGRAMRPRARVFDLGSDTLFDLQPKLRG